ncbi:MAG: hypothetical protein ABSF67_12350 [Roseiarcus sp.]
MRVAAPSSVMAGLDPAIHALVEGFNLVGRILAPSRRGRERWPSLKQLNVDGRIKPGHDA